MPYQSLAQERWAHTPAGTKALGGPSAVAEWDSATKGKKLPTKVKSSDSDADEAIAAHRKRRIVQALSR